MEKLLFNVYKLLTSTKLFKLVLAKTEFEVNRYLPLDDYGVGISTIRLFSKNFLKSVAVFFIAMLIAKFDIRYLITSFIISIACYKDSFVKWQRRQEVRLLRQLSLYLSELRHEYYRNNDLEEAFSASFHTAGEELKLHLGLIEDEFDTNKIPNRYIISIPSRFLLIFVAICQSAIRYGDDDETFVSNIDELQKNIDSDLLKWNREEFLFSAVFFIIIFSFIAMPFMERWGISQVEELSNFYYGYMGSLVRILCILLTLPIFIFFEKMQSCKKQEITPLLSGILEISFINKGMRYLFKHTGIGNSSMAHIFSEYFPEKSYQQFVLLRFIFFISSFLSISLWIILWKKSLLLLVPNILISFLISFAPHFMVAIDGIFYESELEEEIGQVRLMIMSLSSVIGMTIEDILLWIEDFTMYLKESISMCLDQLSSDENEALENLRKKWEKTAFINIIDNLISSDRIGIKESFRDMFSRKDFYIAKRRQEQELNVKKKESILSTFIYLPFMLAVSLYMIVPFLHVSIKNLLDITKSLV